MKPGIRPFLRDCPGESGPACPYLMPASFGVRHLCDTFTLDTDRVPCSDGMKMSKLIPSLLLLAAIASFSWQLSAEGAERMTESELREFMGLYLFKTRNIVISGGIASHSKGEIRQRFRWKGSEGNGVVRVPGGSYRPIAQKVVLGSRSVRFRSILRGSGIDPDSGEFYEIVGLTSLTLTRKGPGNFTAVGNSRIAYGSLAIVIQRVRGRQVR